MCECSRADTPDGLGTPEHSSRTTLHKKCCWGGRWVPQIYGSRTLPSSEELSRLPGVPQFWTLSVENIFNLPVCVPSMDPSADLIKSNVESGLGISLKSWNVNEPQSRVLRPSLHPQGQVPPSTSHSPSKRGSLPNQPFRGRRWDLPVKQTPRQGEAKDPCRPGGCG